MASRPTPPIRKAYLDIPSGQLHYHYSLPYPSSTASPLPVLLLHMSASSSLSFHPLIHALSTLCYSCYAPDMPGFGFSDDPPTDPPNIYADLYYAAFSKLPGLEYGCHVLGHHSGAVIGTELANLQCYGSFVRSLTCVGPAVMSAAQRFQMSKTFLEPFNKPAVSGAHLLKTWEYLQWEGLSPENNLELLQRETIDHVRAWKGRSQIYRCVWAFDCEEALGRVGSNCRILGLCARDDVLWQYFEQFNGFGKGLGGEEIMGGNFGPDLDWEGILGFFVPFISGTS